MFKTIRNMLLHIASNRLLGDIQKDFNTVFPFLKLEFFRADESAAIPPAKRFLPGRYAVQNARRSRQEGDVMVDENMTVSQLENQFLALFGLGVQVHRKSGNLWLETTMTDNWSLKKQNEHGRELSMPPQRNAGNGLDGEYQ